tara:strand:- start:1798 stop:2037 length:240 start_codon:yes stop_codon:yes gene_type:complete
MTQESKADIQKCGKNKNVMLAYGVIQLGTSVFSAIALGAIALGFCSLKNQSKLFNNCVEQITETGKSTSVAVRYCNGGN